MKIINSKTTVNCSSLPASDEWTVSCLVDKLKQYLSTLELSKSKVKTDLLDANNNIFDNYFCLISDRKYVNQAFHYLKIGTLRPIPKFHISLSDLSARLVKELALLDTEDRNFVLKQAVGRIFEDINPKLYHGSISRILKVELVN